MATTLLDRAPWTHLSPRAQIVAAIVLGWVPLVLFAEIEQLVTGRREPLLADVSVHVRLLVAVPLFLVAERALAHQQQETLARLGDEGFVAAGDRARYVRLVERAGRLRRAWLPDAILLALALANGIATLAGWIGPARLVHGPSGAALGWFALVAQPLFVFLLMRAWWRWVIWMRTLVGVARLPLQLALGHPDRHAGLGFVVLPSLAFHVPFLVGVGSVLCASWGMQIATAGASLPQFKTPLIAFVALGELDALAPLLALTPRLFVAARAGVVEYGGLATDYVRRFRRRWMAPAARDEVLGTSDLQSLNDLGAQFRDSVQKTSPILFGPRELVVLAAAMLLPVVPLLLAFLPVEAVLGKLGKMILGMR